MNIQFDETNMLADVVGEGNGITRSAINQNRERAFAALTGFQKQSDAGAIGFPHLPFQTDIRAIGAYAREVRGSFDTVCLIGIGGSALGAWALDCGRFHAAHRDLYGYHFADDPSQQVEWVNLRVTGVGPIRRPRLAEYPVLDGSALTGSRPVCFDGQEYQPTALYDRTRLSPGDTVTGPAVRRSSASRNRSGRSSR